MKEYLFGAPLPVSIPVAASWLHVTLVTDANVFLLAVEEEENEAAEAQEKKAEASFFH